ncbi:MAG TPA: ATP-grasp domain-containing protein [Streptosporangiaceae bacterium]|jgi:biotin carboxylase
MPEYAVIVDPYSGAAECGPAFRARDVSPVAVLSTPRPLAAFAADWHPANFDAVHCYDGDEAALLATLKTYRPVCVIPGNESGVELAEALAEDFAPGTGNVPELAAARRDKWEMARAVSAAGIPVLRQLCTEDPGQVAAWLLESGLLESGLGESGLGESGRASRALVLKPPRSGGTDGTHIVAAGQDWRPAFDEINGAVNRYGQRNHGVLVQELAVGTEYVIDMYSAGGVHGLTEVCRYRKRASGDRLGLYDRTDFVSHEDPCVAELAAYAAAVADAVGVREGATHAEVMLTPDGPRLIEIAARLAGTPLQQAARLATGDCQIDRAVRHVLDGQFTPGYRLHQQVSVVTLSAARGGVLRNPEVLEALRALPTACLASLPHRAGDTVAATQDLFTLLGWVLLADQDPAAVERDYQAIRAAERQVVIS